MVTPDAERKRRSRQKQREKEEKLRHQPRADGTAPFQRTSFSEFYEDYDLDVRIPLDIAGLPALDFSDDTRNPQSHTGWIEEGDPEGEVYAGHVGAVGRAEVAVGCLLDAATALAGVIQAYKLDQISAEEARLNQAAENADAEGRRKIVTDLLRLEKLRGKLNSNVRWTLPQWTVKGE